jgi:hypothetical protein
VSTRERVWDSVDAVVEAAACCVGKITWGVCFGLQNAKSSRTGLVLDWGAQTEVRALGRECGMALRR